MNVVYFNGDKPNIKIIDSYKINCRKEQLNILKDIMMSKEYKEAKRTRSLNSYLKE